MNEPVNGHAVEAQLGPINCIPVMNREEATANVVATRARGYLNFLQLPEVGRRKSGPLAIVAGGPSLRTRIEQVRTFKTVMVAGTAHDYIVQRGISPRYAVLFDPYARGHACNIQCAPGTNLAYHHHLVDTCTYLISSHSEAEIFDWFKDVPVAIWHAYGDADDAAFAKEGSLSGGSTAALRAITMAILLGYWDIHFFGLDSSYDGEASHSYEQGEPLPDRITVKLDNGKQFDSNLAWIAQAQQFFITLQTHGWRFRPTVHGNGMIAEMLRYSQQPAFAEVIADKPAQSASAEASADKPPCPTPAVPPPN